MLCLQGCSRVDVQAISEHAALVAIHDSARPLVTAEDTSRCLLDALQVCWHGPGPAHRGRGLWTGLNRELVAMVHNAPSSPGWCRHVDQGRSVRHAGRKLTVCDG